jgi:hypothetical protein
MTETVTSTGSHSFGIWQCVTGCAVHGDAVQQGTITSWSTDKYAPTDTVSQTVCTYWHSVTDNMHLLTQCHIPEDLKLWQRRCSNLQCCLCNTSCTVYKRHNALHITFCCDCMATLTAVFPCFFLSCKANARVKWARPAVFPIFMLFYVLFVFCHSVYCLCVYVYCTTATAWLTNCS